MTALEKLRSALDAQLKRNVDPHQQFIIIGAAAYDPDNDALYATPTYEHGQEPDEEGEPDWLTLFDMRAVLDEIAELQQREPLPFKQVHTDPGEAYMAMLAEWKDDATKLAYYKEQESEKRVMLFAGAFPNPKEGTQRFKLADGRTIVGKYTINRKIDEAALPATLAAMREQGVANTDALVSYKPSLAKREWNTLGEEHKLIFSACVIATPGKPSLEVDLPKALK